MEGPGSYRILPDLHLLVTRFGGMLTASTILELYRAAYGDPAYVSGMNEYVDFGGAVSVTFSSDDLRRIRDLTARASDGEAGAMRTAVFAPTDLVFGLARMYGSLAEGGPETVAAFRDRQEALRWLGVPDARWVEL